MKLPLALLPTVLLLPAFGTVPPPLAPPMNDVVFTDDF
jgi:hypothetical protein